MGVNESNWTGFSPATSNVGSKHWKCSREVYRDDDNDVDAQLQRLTRLQLLAQQAGNILWSSFMVSSNAFAGAKACKQPGSDGVVVEMVRALSWSTLLWLYLLFLVRLGGWETERPEAWREVVLTAIPKKSDKVGFRSMSIHLSAASAVKSSTFVLYRPLSDVRENHMRQTSWATSRGDPLLESRVL